MGLQGSESVRDATRVNIGDKNESGERKGMVQLEVGDGAMMICENVLLKDAKSGIGMGVLSKQGDSAKCSVEDKNWEGTVQYEGRDDLGKYGDIHCVGLGLCGGTMGTMMQLMDGDGATNPAEDIGMESMRRGNVW